MSNWKGKCHIPALAFVIGGSLAFQEKVGFFLLAGLTSYWLFLYRRQLPLLMLIVCFGFFGYFYLSPSSYKNLPTLQEGVQVKWEGGIVSDVKETPHAYQVILKDENNEKQMVVYFKEDGNLKPHDWHHGSHCALIGSAEAFAQARNPGQFDYRSFMAEKGIVHQLIVSDLTDIQCDGRSFLSYIYEWRMEMDETLRQRIDPKAYGWIKALVLGETDELSDETLDWFREFNVSHILAISGLHTGLMVGGVYLFFFRLGIAAKRQVHIMIFLSLPVYTILAGAAPSVIRASLMALSLILMVLMNRKVPLTDLLSLAAFGLLLYSPSFFYNIGFQFSFLVTFSLILSTPIFKQHDGFWVQSIIVSFVSQLSILAFQIHYFYEFQPLSLFVNLLVVPYFSFFVIPFMMILFLLSQCFPFISYNLSSYFISFHEWVLSTVINFSRALDFKWVLGELTSSIIILYTIFFMVMMKKWGEGKKGSSFFYGGLTVGVLMISCVLPYFSSKGTVTMLDIGQGDTFVIELPYRRGVIVIDAAGPPVYTRNQEKIAAEIILPYLKSKGIDEIHAVFISHEDSDHNGSVTYLLEEMDVNRMFVSAYYKVEDETKNVVHLQRGDQVKIGGYAFDVISPETDRGNPNDNSLVLSSDIGGKRWLFTGDISVGVEDALLLNSPLLKADVLKVGHHGSNTSTSEEWITLLKPDVALISAGVNNRYGHPHKDVLDRLEHHQILVLQTNRHGAVQYNFSHQSGTFSTFLPYNASRE
ncbi:DNA internalization-related competence protein ComEC/Rec2 [Halobacillus litoralis]|uniref:DNA internalization-related competence protein ComEC/Rec2 n=1 Tax=Halobacillus litoralis TaxID=45668 RepID=UPI001CFC6744|nr:DNA internalization-related competence protein ComEC/Rec2 [Halobacillus litoralis]